MKFPVPVNRHYGVFTEPRPWARAISTFTNGYSIDRI